MRSSIPFRLRFWSLWTLLALAPFASCRVAPSDLGTLAGEPSSPFAVLLTGGAFLSDDAEPAASESALRRTYGEGAAGEASRDEGSAGGDKASRAAVEAIPLDRIASALRAARVFVRVERDPRDVAQRATVAEAHALDDGAVAAPVLRDMLDDAQRAGCDYALVVERVADGPIDEYGVNGRWPITAAAWLLLGIGLVIPDHTFESRAELRVALRDVHSGRAVYRRVFDGDPVDLSLFDRTDLWGLLQSIIIPPFWVGNDEAAVVAEVRRETTSRLLFLMAQDLKSVGCLEGLRSEAPAVISALRVDDALRVQVRSVEGLSFARVGVRGEPQDSAAAREFVANLLGSARIASDGGFAHEADLPWGRGRPELQILVQTVSGRVASTTVSGSTEAAESR